MATFEFNERDYEPKADWSQLEACFDQIAPGNVIKHKKKRYLVLNEITEYFPNMVANMKTGEVFQWKNIIQRGII